MKLLGLVMVLVAFTTACSGPTTTSPLPAAEATPTAGPAAAAGETTPELPVMVSVQSLVESGASLAQAECYVNAGDPGGTGFITEPDAALEAFGSCLLRSPPVAPGETSD